MSVSNHRNILGLDLSEKMIARAKADTDDPAIEYVLADLELVELSVASFDFAYSSLVFHYVENFGRLVKTVFDALVPSTTLSELEFSRAI